MTIETDSKFWVYPQVSILIKEIPTELHFDNKRCPQISIVSYLCNWLTKITLRVSQYKCITKFITHENITSRVATSSQASKKTNHPTLTSSISPTSLFILSMFFILPLANFPVPGWKSGPYLLFVHFYLVKRYL